MRKRPNRPASRRQTPARPEKNGKRARTTPILRCRDARAGSRTSKADSAVRAGAAAATGKCQAGRERQARRYTLRRMRTPKPTGLRRSLRSKMVRAITGCSRSTGTQLDRHARAELRRSSNQRTLSSPRRLRQPADSPTATPRAAQATRGAQAIREAPAICDAGGSAADPGCERCIVRNPRSLQSCRRSRPGLRPAPQLLVQEAAPKSQDSSSQAPDLKPIFDVRQARRVLGQSAGFANRTEPARHSCGAGGHSGSRDGRLRAIQSLGAGFRRAYGGGSAEGRPAGCRKSVSNPRCPRFADAGTNPRPVCGHCSDSFQALPREPRKTDPRKTQAPRSTNRSGRTPIQTSGQTWSCRGSKPRARRSPASGPAAPQQAAPRLTWNAFRSEPPAAPPTSTHDIRVRVPDNNGGSTQVRFVESGGEVRVSVRTADEGLAQNLRTHLNDLTQRLSDGGMPAEIWKPALERRVIAK